MLKISAFTITTNNIKNQYPVIESVKSILPLVDEVVIVDGGSTDNTVEELKKLGDKIVIIQDEDSKWEHDWIYSQMGKNWSRGFDECAKRGADFIIKFDTDYIFDNTFKLREEFEGIKDKVLRVGFHRLNFQLVDRHFNKSPKTLAVNYKMCKEKGLNVRWGYDMKNFGLCDEAIIYKFTEHNLLQGELLSKSSHRHITQLRVYNYGYCFRDKKTAEDIMYRNMIAFWGQLSLMGQSKPSDISREAIWKANLEMREKEHTKFQNIINIDRHPIEIQDKIKNLTPDKQGYNFYGRYETASYFK